MDADTLTTPHFPDDDRFLLKYLPGDAPRLRKLRAEIYSLNTENLELVRFVLLVGPTGTGKNYVARVCAGHRRWLQISKAKDELDPGRDYPGCIAPLDLYLDRFGEKMLPATPEGLVESELFGHMKGAFSGAVTNTPGLFRDNGYQDILLDEIGEAAPFLQAKLLGVLEGRPFTPVGGSSKERSKCDKRIFMATNRNLQEMVENHQFRQDLFFRIRRCTISLPPLSADPDLVPEVATAILNRLAPKKFKGEALPTFSAADNEWLKQQRWGGNARELEEVIELWLAAGCRESIKAVAATRHFGDTAADASSAVLGNNTNDIVRAKIEGILAGRSPSPGTIGKFVESFTATVAGEVIAVLLDWYNEARRNPDTLRRLFPEMAIPSIRTQMSRGRRTR